MLKDGTYVRLLMATNTRMGTISQGAVEDGREKYVFHHDRRFDSITPDFRVSNSDIEECAYPSDAEVQAINALKIKREN